MYLLGMARMASTIPYVVFKVIMTSETDVFVSIVMSFVDNTTF